MPPGQRADLYAQSVVNDSCRQVSVLTYMHSLWLDEGPCLTSRFFSFSIFQLLRFHSSKELQSAECTSSHTTLAKKENCYSRDIHEIDPQSDHVITCDIDFFFFFWLGRFQMSDFSKKMPRMRWTALVACWCRIVPWDRRFSFPKNLHRQALWIAAVQQKDLEPKIKKDQVVSFLHSMRLNKRTV